MLDHHQAVGPLRTILHRRSKQFGLLPLLAPLLAAATVTAILIFRDQTLGGEIQASMLKRAVGPSLSWFDEHIRYERLFMASPDGSVARRFAVLAVVLALGITVAMSLRKGRIPGTAAGPSRRIVGITTISFIAMMFTPTKWTHHFGVFAGLAGPLGALAAVAVTSVAMRSRRNRTVFAAVVLFLVALSFASVNGWWYVSNFGVPWSNAFPAWHYAFATALLGLTLLVLLLAGWFHFVATDNGTPRNTSLARIIQSPLAIATWLLVVFEVMSLTLAMAGQYPAWTVGRSNLEALAGKSCGLAEDVLVEQDPNAGMLAPVTGPAGDALGAGLSEAFSPNGIPADVRADPVMERPGDRSFVNDDDKTASSQAGTEGGTTPAPGINGSLAQLPFSLDARRTPVLGSWRSGVQVPAHLRSGWYRLPNRDQAGPLLVVSAAGRFDPHEVQVQWATDADAAAGKPGGSFPVRRRRRVAGLAQPAARVVRNSQQRHSDSPGRQRRRPGPPALDRADAAANPEATHAAGRRRLRRSGVPGLAGRAGIPVPARVRPSERRRRDAEVAHPAGPIRRRGQLAGDGQQRWRALGRDRVAGEGDHGRDLSQGRLVPGLGFAAEVDAVLRERTTGPPRPRIDHTQWPVEPGAATPVAGSRRTKFEDVDLSRPLHYGLERHTSNLNTSDRAVHDPEIGYAGDITHRQGVSVISHVPSKRKQALCPTQ